MNERTQTNKPRIFISHAWEDKAWVKQLETQLKAAGAEVWVDHVGIRGGDNLPKRISEALEWCNTLLLIWSKSSSQSHWVELEWSNAISLQKNIIPCRMDTVPLPAILAHKAYIDFSKNDQQVIAQLLQSLDLIQQPIISATVTEPIIPVTHNTALEIRPRLPQVLLRAQPVNALSIEAVQKMLKERNFFDSKRNKNGKGMSHQYEAIEREGQKLVMDHSTGLTWQQSGSSNPLTYADAEKFIHNLNNQFFAGYNDWRLPTLEEAMSLMEPLKYGKLYLNPVFDRTQLWIWTSDKYSTSSAWCFSFTHGHCYNSDVDKRNYNVVRGVR